MKIVDMLNQEWCPNSLAQGNHQSHVAGIWRTLIESSLCEKQAAKDMNTDDGKLYVYTATERCTVQDWERCCFNPANQAGTQRGKPCWPSV